MITDGGKERRVFERVVPKDVIFATVRPTFDRMGRIRDISKGGLAMEYTLLEEKPGLSEKIHVDIFNNERKYNLFNVPCNVIYDVPVVEEEGFLTTVETRRCGVKFDRLRPEQAAHLEAILRELSAARHEEGAEENRQVLELR